MQWLVSLGTRCVWNSRRTVFRLNAWLIFCCSLSQILIAERGGGGGGSKPARCDSKTRGSQDNFNLHLENGNISQSRLSSKFIPKSASRPLDNVPKSEETRNASHNKPGDSILRFHHAKNFVASARKNGFHQLNDAIGENVSTFVYFIGFPRSSHSIVGSFIDAHPHALVADEFHVFGQMQKNPSLFSNKADVAEAMWEDSWLAVNGGGTRDETFKGYDLKLPQLFNGAFNHSIQLVGDKMGPLTIEAFANNRKMFEHNLRKLESWFKVETIMVVRNPFDNIATLTMYSHIANVLRISRRGTNHITELKSLNSCLNRSESLLNSPSILSKAIESYSKWIGICDQIITQLNPDINVISISDFIRSPSQSMRELCDFLEIQCSTEFLGAIERKTFHTESKSRHNIKWTRETCSKVDALLDRYPNLFKGMSFFD